MLEKPNGDDFSDELAPNTDDDVLICFGALFINDEPGLEKDDVCPNTDCVLSVPEICVCRGLFVSPNIDFVVEANGVDWPNGLEEFPVEIENGLEGVSFVVVVNEKLLGVVELFSGVENGLEGDGFVVGVKSSVVDALLASVDDGV